VLFSSTAFGRSLHASFGGRKPTIGILGDSYGEQGVLLGLKHCLRSRYAAEVDLDYRAYADGGRLFSVGGTGTSHLAATQIPQFQLRPADVAFIWSGYNNAMADATDAATAATHITDAATACIAAGAQLVVLHGHGCTGANARTQWAVQSFNTQLARFAAGNDRVVFLDMTAILGDPNSSSSTTIPWRGGTGSYLSYSVDGVHTANGSADAIAAAYEPILQAIATQRNPRAIRLASGLTYSPSLRPDTEVLGDASMFLGTGGGGNANVAAGWNLTQGDTWSLTPSLTTTSDGFRCQRFALGGSAPTPFIWLEIDINAGAAFNGGDATRLFDAEIVIDFTGVTGLTNAGFYNRGMFQESFFSNWNRAQSFPDLYTKRWFLYTLTARR
jgi:hypothetical protein